MKSTGSKVNRNDDERPDWRAMDRRLTIIEDSLVTIQTVVNLMLDLLERTIPIDPESDSRNSSSSSE